MAGIVSIGFLLSNAGATYVDARLLSHVRFGARAYRFGYTVSAIAIPLFLSTLAALDRAQSRGSKCVAASVPLLAALVCSQWAFAPEVPHSGIVGSCGMYAVAVLIATWLHYSAPDLEFLHDLSLSVPVRLEGLKSAVTLWQGIALATCAGFLAGVIPWPVALMNANAHVVSSARDLFLLNSLSVLHVGVMIIAFLIGPIHEAVRMVIMLTGRFSEIREAETLVEPSTR